MNLFFRIIVTTALVALAVTGAIMGFLGLMWSSGDDVFTHHAPVILWPIVFMPPFYLLFAAACFLRPRASRPLRVIHYILCGTAAVCLSLTGGWYLTPIAIGCCLLWTFTTVAPASPRPIDRSVEPDPKPGVYDY